VGDVHVMNIDGTGVQAITNIPGMWLAGIDW
jgi:hypothetical protein